MRRKQTWAKAYDIDINFQTEDFANFLNLFLL